MIIEKKIDYWKNKLLDLSKRNKMINFPEQKVGKRVSRSRLILYAPNIRKLWKTLVIDEESLKFPIEEIKYYENSDDNQVRFSDIDCFSTGIRTNQSISEACKTLIKLKQRSREFMDNKGMNSLFLIFGFLRWKENGIEGQEMRSPLLLVPVTIIQRKLTDPIFLSKIDDDPICNTALQQKLNHDFNISIPEFEDGMDITEYLKTVEKMCKRVGWTVESDNAVLSMLNYLKMPMYKDIQAHEEIIKNHFLVRTLNGERSFYDFDSIPDIKSVDHDKIDPRSVYSVVDADSSQQDAIYLAKNGTSFVLQGPPGTGKSQTITNIIAELLGQGKKVLFVSEKMAALQVVYRRLVSTGLGDFCLTLHNPNAKRKEIIEQLESSLNLSNSKVAVSKDAIRKLTELETAREELNDYVRQINRTISPLEETIYHVNGIIAQFDAYPDIDYVQENADKVTLEELSKMVDALSEFVRIIEKQGYQNENPWVGCTERSINHIFRQRFSARTDEITIFLEQGMELCKKISSVIRGNDNIENEEFFYSTIKGYEELLLSASICKGVPRAWYDLDTDKLLEEIQRTIDLIADNVQEQKRIDNVRVFCRDLTFATSKILEYAIADDADSINLTIKELNCDFDNLAAQISKNLAFKINYCKNTLLLGIQQFTAVLSKVNELKSLQKDSDTRISGLEEEIEAQNQLITDCNSTYEEARAVLASNNNEKFISAAIKPLLDRFRLLSQNDFGQGYIKVSDEIIRGSENLSLYNTGLSESIKSYCIAFPELKEIYLQKNAVIQKSKEVSAEIEHQKSVLTNLQEGYEAAISKVNADNNSEFLTFDLSNIRTLFDRMINSPFDENYKMCADILINELGVVSLHANTGLELFVKDFIEGYNSLIKSKNEESDLNIELKTIKASIEEARIVFASDNNEVFISAAIKPLLERIRWLSYNDFGEDYIKISENLIKGSDNLSLYNPELTKLVKSFKTTFSELKEIYLQKNAALLKYKELSVESDRQKRALADLQIGYESAIGKVKSDNNSNFLTFDLSNIKSLFNRIMNSPFDENYKNSADILIKELGLISSHVNTGFGLVINEFIEGYNSLIKSKNEEAELVIELKTIKTAVEEQLSVLSKYERERDKVNSLLFASYNEGILSLDVSGIKTRIDQEYQSAFRSIKKQYRKDIKTIKSFSKNDEHLSFEVFVSVINLILDAHEKQNQYEVQKKLVSELEIKEQGCIKRRDVTTDTILRQQGFIKALISRIVRLLDTVIDTQNQGIALKDKSNLVDELSHQLISSTAEINGINVHFEQLQNTLKQLCTEILSQLTEVSEFEIKEQDCIKRRNTTTETIIRQQAFIKDLISKIIRLLDTIIEAQNQSEALKNQSNLVDGLHNQLISLADEEKSINVQFEQSEKTVRQLCADILSQLVAIEDAQNKQKALNEHNAVITDFKQRLSYSRQERGNISDQITEKQNELFKEKERIKSSVDNMIEIIKQVSEQQESEYEKLSAEYRRSFDRISSELGITINDDNEITNIHDKIKWLCEFKHYAAEQKAGEAFITSVLKAEDEYINILNSRYQETASWSNRFSEQVGFFIDLFDQEHRNAFLELSIPSLKTAITNCRQNINLLETYISYNNVVNRMNQIGVGGYVRIVEKQRLDSKAIIPAFKKCFYRSWLDKITESLTGINSFRRDSHEERIERFKALDVSHIKISREILKRKLVDSLPYMDFIGRDEESSILKREMKKKKRFMPIRRLVNALPSLLPTLKPCMMMSPISVSTYFGQSNYEFDTVIFDEASQICTEDAICSIFRAKQVIIAGDSKQLPPTNFFSSSLEYDDEEEKDDDDDEEEFDDVGAYESLLAEASGFPSQTLLWHYRSKHEHLIAFSNYKIYESKLITFPSSVDKGKDIGVEYVYVSDGVYNKRGNIKEAEKIVELLANHFINHPERSVGIITFSINQQSVIENEVLKLRQTRPEFEEFFKEDIDEPFFIRSLESVQGDERDTIIMSICYGKAPDGRIRMNFGPLSKDGGERRLNVAVTRARFNMKLVGSILPTDLNLSNTTTQGPKLLRDYIDFAINGEQVLKGDNTVSDEIVFDSPFEESVYDFLVGKGYRVATQVGCSGYRIDMAVYHPEYNGRFVIGIECDGASYHSARTARERDRLRQTILEDMGWKFYRIWSTDWIKDPEYEKNRLVEAIERAILVYHENMPENNQKKTDENDFPEVIEVTTKTSVTEPKKDYSSKFNGSKPLDIPISDYKETVITFLSMGYGSNQKESLIKTAAKLAYGWDRVGSNIRKQFNKAINALEREGKIEVVGDIVKLH